LVGALSDEGAWPTPVDGMPLVGNRKTRTGSQRAASRRAGVASRTTENARGGAGWAHPQPLLLETRQHGDAATVADGAL
jgi:hypothetical protein